MTMDQFAMWFGYGVMVFDSVLIVMVVVWLILDGINEFNATAAKAARQTYWWLRWERFHRLAKARKASRAKGQG